MHSSELLCLSREGIVVLNEELSDLGLEWVVGVRVLEQGNHTLNDEAGILRWDPIIFDGLRADLPRLLLDVGVVDLRLEEDLRALKRIGI